MAKKAFLAVNNFFLVRFQKYLTNNNCVFIVFKAESEPKHEENIFIWVFLQKPKFAGKNKIVLKLKFQICISAFVLYCKRKLHTNLKKKILIFKPPGIFENKNFDARVLVRAARRNFRFGLLKSCLTFG